MSGDAPAQKAAVGGGPRATQALVVALELHAETPLEAERWWRVICARASRRGAAPATSEASARAERDCKHAAAGGPAGRSDGARERERFEWAGCLERRDKLSDQPYRALVR